MRLGAVYTLICAALFSCLAHADVYESVRIVSPEPEEAVHDNNGNVTVAVTVLPHLRAETGDHFIVLLDNSVAASGSNQVFQLSSIERGSHTLQVQLVTANGTVVATSPPVTFYMWQASRLFRQRTQ